MNINYNELDTHVIPLVKYFNESSNCIHKDVFWENAGCNLKNGMEPCKFELKEK